MKKKINPTAVGIFLVGAMALIAMGIMVFGTGELFSRKQKAVIYFRGSVSGLQVGAPVKYQGVVVGAVKSLHLWYDTKTNTPTVPVVIEISQKQLSGYTSQTVSNQTLSQIESGVAEGLRAKLEMESMVTGVLYVGLDMAPARKGYTPNIAGLFPDYPVIPSIETTMDTIMTAVSQAGERLAKVDLEGISTEAKNLLTSLNEKVGALDTKEISGNIVALTRRGRELLEDENLKQSFVKLNATMEDVEAFAEKLNGTGGESLDELKLSLQQISSAVHGLEEAVAEAKDMIAPNSRLRVQTMNSLDELGQAARAIRELADYLQRNPNALVTGKKKPE